MMKALERFPLYPFLAACYPVVFLLSVNRRKSNPRLVCALR